MYATQYNAFEVMRMIDENVVLNLKSELRRGTQTLEVLSQLAKNQYGYSLLQTLEEKHVPIEAGTLYPLLRRLESQGLLISEWDTSENRPRKYYRLSESGMQVLSDLLEEWKTIVNELDSFIKGEKL